MATPAPTYQAPVAQQPANVRTEFMTRVYVRLMVAIAVFIGVQYLLFQTGIAEAAHSLVFGGTNWLVFLGGFMIVSWLANSMTRRATSPTVAYGGFALLIVANALLFSAPLFEAFLQDSGIISLAAQISLIAFAGLSAIAILSAKDFTFLRPLLMWGGFLALGLIVLSALFGFNLGVWFPIAMIGFAGGAILYDTQIVYRTYPPQMATQAAMSLFSSIALLFWYVLQLLLRR